MLNGGDDKDKKSQEKCLLSSTLRCVCTNDLNVILLRNRAGRDNPLKKDCRSMAGLFDYAHQVGYTITLEGCRQSDDWERLYSLLDNLFCKIAGENNTIQECLDNQIPSYCLKQKTNLQFAIDQVVQFINRYSDFVNQGAEIYKKFAKIADSYENEKSLLEVLPDQFCNSNPTLHKPWISSTAPTECRKYKAPNWKTCFTELLNKPKYLSPWKPLLPFYYHVKWPFYMVKDLSALNRIKILLPEWILPTN